MEKPKIVKIEWVDKEDIRVSEPRILNFVRGYGEENSENILIRGDNLLVLRTLVEQFKYIHILPKKAWIIKKEILQ